MGYRDYSTALGRIVDTGGKGDFTTISSALTAASSGQTIFIRPGTYTENLTLKAGVNLTAYNCDAFNNVIISGNATLSTAGTVNISGIRLQTNSAALLTVSGSVASIVNLINCYINCTNNTGITYSSSSASSAVKLISCTGNLGTTGIAYFTHTSAGGLGIYNTDLDNTGLSTTASTISAGSIEIINSFIKSPLTTSSTAAISGIQNTSFITNFINTTCLTVGGSGGSVAVESHFNAGTASAISIGSSLTLGLCTIGSSNTNAITGAGTLVNAGLSFIDTSYKINTSTQTARNFDVGGISFDGGTNLLSTFSEGTWTNVLAGSGTAGSPTYTEQQGRYQKVGNYCQATSFVGWSASGGATGNWTITGLPFTAATIANTVWPMFEAWSTYLNTSASGTATIPMSRVVSNSTTITIGTYVTATGSLGAFAVTTSGSIYQTVRYLTA